MSETFKKTILSLTDKLVTELNRLHDSAGKTWDQIAALPEYHPIPKATLNAIAREEIAVPPRWYSVLGWPHTVEVPYCFKCGFAHEHDCSKYVLKPRTRKKKTYATIQTMPKDELTWRLLHREEMKDV